MSRPSIFGMRVVVAEAGEWDEIVKRAKKAGGIEINEAVRTDYEIVINENAGIIFVNPAREAEVMATFRALPEAGK